jgi:hypothetical protein
VKRRFDPGTPPHVAVAQRTERWPAKPEAARLSRAGDTTRARSSARRAPASQAGGRRSKASRVHQAGVAQRQSDAFVLRRWGFDSSRRLHRRSCRHSSANRVPGFEPGGRRFESCWRRQLGYSARAGVARQEARPVGTGKAVGSTPTIGSTSSFTSRIDVPPDDFGQAGRHGLSRPTVGMRRAPQRSTSPSRPMALLRPDLSSARGTSQ